MNKRLSWFAIWTTPILALGVAASLPQTSKAATTVNISCKTNDNVPTVIASVTEQGTEKDVTILSFLPQYFSAHDAVQQCKNTAKTLQSLYITDTANYLTSDKLNAKPVVCAVERRGIGCAHESALVLFTLAPTADPSRAFYEMLGHDFKQTQLPDSRTVSRIYSDIKPRRLRWWRF